MKCIPVVKKKPSAVSLESCTTLSREEITQQISEVKGTDDPQLCFFKAISYKCPYIIAIVVHYQIYTVVMIIICANQKIYILFRFGVLSHLSGHISKSAWFMWL